MKNVKHTLSDLKTLGHQLLSSRSHINNLPLLLTHVNSTSPPQYVLESLLSLQSFFLPLLPDLPPSTADRSKSKDDSEFIYRAWLRSKFHDFITCLIDVLISPHPEDTLKEVVLHALMEFVKLANAGGFHPAIYFRLLSSIVCYWFFSISLILNTPWVWVCFLMSLFDFRSILLATVNSSWTY